MKATVAALLFAALPAAAADDPAAATRGFVADCARAGEALWGRSLCAPVVLVDPAKPEPLWTSIAAPPEPLPPMRANTAIDWGGATWLMLLAPLPAADADRRALLFHEAFHVHQHAFGLPANATVAAHLDTAAARESLRLEWNALARALQSDGDARRAHLQQALAFRAQRLADPGAADAERAQMLHEGLAAYTGTALSGESVRIALSALKERAAKPGFARTFAYASGPAWGLMLDALQPGWRTHLDTTTDLPDLAGLAPAAVPTPTAYDGDAIHAEETAAAAARQAHLDRLLAATDPARSLRLPLAQMQMDFDPGRVTPVPDGSTIYEKITLRDAWGGVQVDGVPLRITADFSAAFVPWPLPEGALSLTSGWHLDDAADATPTLVAPRQDGN
jgi:hypothetical protein